MARGITERIRQDATNGGSILLPGGKLPSLRALAEHYRCGLATVQRAIDRLETEGLLRVVRGRGTFLLGSTDAPARRKSKMLGAILLEGSFMHEFHSRKEMYLADGWLFSIYDATPDHQSPEKERLFLENANTQNFAGVIIEASPYQPTNQELFLRLRSDGCKVIHTVPYLDDMSGECYFLVDYQQNAELATLKVALAGYKEILYVGRPRTAPHVGLIEKGIANIVADADLHVLGRLCVQHKETEAILQALSSLPRQSAILCFDTELGEIVRYCCGKLGRTIPKDFGLVSVINSFAVNPQHSHVVNDPGTILTDILAYAMDNRRSPFENIHRLYRGTFCDLGTLQKTS